MKIGNILWKLLAVLVITAGGAALTCGGNILLANTGLGEFLYILWGIEIFIIFIWSIRKLFFQTETWNSQTKLMKTLIFVIPLLGIMFTFLFLEMLSGI